MPRPMLKQPDTRVESGSILSATHTQQTNNQNQQMNKMVLDRILRKNRSKEYMDAIHRLDAGGHAHNHQQINEILDAIRSEFPDIDINGVLLGYVSQCYLGDPYEVHTVDMTGQIIEHYKKGEVLPDGLEKARSLALRGGYDFIEVYIDCCRCISSTGAVSVVTG